MKKVTVLDSNEISKMLEELGRPYRTGRSKMVACRNACMFLLMLDAGLRVGELVQLLQGDLEFERGCTELLCVRVEISKGGRERLIPLSPRIKQAVRSLCVSVWPETTDWRSHYAFYKNNPHVSLTTRQVQRIILEAGRAALNRRVTPHMLRHTFATRVLAASNIRVVQQLLGHASIQTTQIYTHPNSLDHRNAIAVISSEELDSNPQQT